MREVGQQRSSFQALLVGVAALLVLVLVIAGSRSYRDLLAVKNRESEIRQRIVGADQRIEALEERIEHLEMDPATLERLAREDLGLVKPGDVVILLPEEPSHGATGGL